jgi:hypothetical protein
MHGRWAPWRAMGRPTTPQRPAASLNRRSCGRSVLVPSCRARQDQQPLGGERLRHAATSAAWAWVLTAFSSARVARSVASVPSGPRSQFPHAPVSIFCDAPTPPALARCEQRIHTGEKLKCPSCANWHTLR